MSSSSTRAKALPPDERRQSIIDAALPLIAAQGSAVRTRDLAHAAGIAEGTIFRVFPDKETLIEACVDEVLSPAALSASFAHIDVNQPLETRLQLAVEVIQRRTQRMFQLMSALNLPRKSIRSRAEFAEAETTALAGIIEPEADRFRFEPIECARILRGLAFMTAHPLFRENEHENENENDTDDPRSVVSIALHGIARGVDDTPLPHHAHAPHDGGPA